MQKLLITTTLVALCTAGAMAEEHEEVDLIAADFVEELEADADQANGADLYQSVCRNCHGPKAQGVASYPKLSDKDTQYLADRLATYRTGQKIGPNSMLMIPHAEELTDQEIVDIVSYITTEFQ